MGFVSDPLPPSMNQSGSPGPRATTDPLGLAGGPSLARNHPRFTALLAAVVAVGFVLQFIGGQQGWSTAGLMLPIALVVSGLLAFGYGHTLPDDPA